MVTDLTFSIRCEKTAALGEMKQLNQDNQEQDTLEVLGSQIQCR